MLSGIYKITCLNNDKFYIGSSININRRLKVHQTLLNKNKHPNKRLQNCWNEYGKQSFRFEIIETINNIKQLQTREKWWLDNTKCYKREIGFNISSSPHAVETGRFIDLIGQKFGKLIPIKYLGNYKYLCICNCGNEKIIISQHLRSGSTKSCGCINLKHGYSGKNKSKSYKTWCSLKQRCLNPKNKDYKNYGDRGIIICQRWLRPHGQGFINFFKDMGEIPKEKELDRIDNNKGYSPDNCKLSTRKEQSRNMRKNIYLTFNNNTKLLIEFAEKYSIPYKTLWARIHKYKWPIKKALTISVKPRKTK